MTIRKRTSNKKVTLMGINTAFRIPNKKRKSHETRFTQQQYSRPFSALQKLHNFITFGS